MDRSSPSFVVPSDPAARLQPCRDSTFCANWQPDPAVRLERLPLWEQQAADSSNGQPTTDDDDERRRSSSERASERPFTQ